VGVGVIIQGDCLDILKTLESESVHCCVTSPPYYGLRQYLFDNAVVIRYDLTEEEKDYLEKELINRGIRPRQ
jgi:DNA modification methylase